MHTARVLTIGEFSRMTHLSVRTLRRYGDAGLLEPATVDSASGYRYYSVDQIPTAQVIHRLRELEVPLPDVRRILGSPDPGVRAALVAEHLRRLETELDRTRGAVTSLRRLLQPDPAPLDVELRAVTATTVAAIEDDVTHHHVLAWYAGAMAELDAVVDEPTGAPGGLYDNELFEDGRGHMLVYVPTDQPARGGRVHPVTLPAVELAVTTHRAEHDDIDVTYSDGRSSGSHRSDPPRRLGLPGGQHDPRAALAGDRVRTRGVSTEDERLSGGDKSCLVGDDHELCTVAGTELHHGVADVGAGRGGAEEQVGADLIVAPALSDQREDLSFAFGEHREPLLGRLVGSSFGGEL